MVRGLVGQIPLGRVMSYGAVGRAAQALGRPLGGARTVAWVLASLGKGEAVPWHRVVGAGGVILLPDRRGALQKKRLLAEGVRFTRGVIAPRHLIDELELLQARPARARRSR